MLLSCSPEILHEYDLRRLMRVISRDVCRLTKAEHCSTYMVDLDSQEIWTQVQGLRREIRYKRTCFTSTKVQILTHLLGRLPISHGIVGQVAKSAETVQINEARELKGALIGDSAQVVQSLICCPVTDRRGNALAVIQTFHSQANEIYCIYAIFFWEGEHTARDARRHTFLLRLLYFSVNICIIY